MFPFLCCPALESVLKLETRVEYELIWLIKHKLKSQSPPVKVRIEMIVVANIFCLTKHITHLKAKNMFQLLIPDICHGHTDGVRGEKICHVEKFQISVHDRC